MNSGNGEAGIKKGHLACKALPQRATLGKDTQPTLQHDRMTVRTHRTPAGLTSGKEGLRGPEMHGVLARVKNALESMTTTVC